MSKTILVVDDDPELRQLLRDHLSGHGYNTLMAGDGIEMWRLLADDKVDLIVLDLMLPGDDGLTLCRELRNRTAIPILMLSARGDETDRVIGLEVGADDYIAKPFGPRELLARIKSILRRVGELGTKRGAQSRQLPLGLWLLDVDTRYLINPDGIVISVSSGEFKLLKLFAESPNRVLSRDQLLEVLAGREAGPYDRTVDVMISRLRRRLGDDGREPALIKTIRNEGYLLASTATLQA